MLSSQLLSFSNHSPSVTVWFSLIFFYLHCLTVSWSLVLLPLRKILMRLNQRELPSLWVQDSWILTVSLGTTIILYPNCSHRCSAPSVNTSVASHDSSASPPTPTDPCSAPSCPDSQGLWRSDPLSQLVYSITSLLHCLHSSCTELSVPGLPSWLFSVGLWKCHVFCWKYPPFPSLLLHASNLEPSLTNTHFINWEG